MTRGLNKEFIFKNDKNKRLYLKYLLNHTNWDKTTILGYVVMENHFHMLVYTKSITAISKTMSSVNTRFAKYYNKSIDRTGYVFTGRFKAQPIVDRNHLFNCLTYIHKNPVKANLCGHESEYAYSSYWEYLDEKFLISNQSAELLFGTADKKNTSIYIFKFIIKIMVMPFLKKTKRLIMKAFLKS